MKCLMTSKMCWQITQTCSCMWTIIVSYMLKTHRRAWQRPLWLYPDLQMMLLAYFSFNAWIQGLNGSNVCVFHVMVIESYKCSFKTYMIDRLLSLIVHIFLQMFFLWSVVLLLFLQSTPTMRKRSWFIWVELFLWHMKVTAFASFTV